MVIVNNRNGFESKAAWGPPENMNYDLAGGRVYSSSCLSHDHETTQPLAHKRKKKQRMIGIFKKAAFSSWSTFSVTHDLCFSRGFITGLKDFSNQKHI